MFHVGDDASFESYAVGDTFTTPPISSRKIFTVPKPSSTNVRRWDEHCNAMMLSSSTTATGFKKHIDVSIGWTLDGAPAAQEETGPAWEVPQKEPPGHALHI